MKNNLYIGFDIGTTNIKAVLIDETLSIIESIEENIIYIKSCNEFKEIEPNGLIELIYSIIKKLAKCADNVNNIKSISFSGAAGSTLLLDKENKPLTNIISWIDTRKIKTDFTKEEIYPITGWPLVDAFPLAHISWWSKHCPDLFKKAKRVVLNTDYITSVFTGKFFLDYSSASTFHLFNQVENSWHKPFLNKLNLRKEQLSKLLPTGSNIGYITKKVALKIGLSSKTDLILGSFDHPSAAYASNITSNGDLLLSCGTSWVGFYPIKKRKEIIEMQMLVDPFMSNLSGHWGGIFSLPKVGNIIDEWLKVLFKRKDYKQFDYFAEKSKGKSNIFKIDLFKDSTLKNNIIKTKSKEEICRALMQATAYMMQDKIAQFTKKGLKANNITIVGGPTKSKIWIEIIESIINKKIKIHKAGQYTGALGAAMYAKNNIKT